MYFSRITCYNYVAIMFPALCFLASCNGQADEAAVVAVKDSSGFELVWADEFNGNAVDTTNWNFETGGEGWGNHEQEYYQSANASTENGNLIITGRREAAGKNNFTSSRMTTKGKHEFLYGKMEARIKIPVGQGIWPAFWMLGANIDSLDWPACGEIDIMEHINKDSLLYGTPHWDNNGHVQKGDTLKYTPSDYHVYGVEWDENRLQWFLDGNKFHELNISDSSASTEEFHRPFFLLLNMALGGDWPGQVIDETKLPAKMYIDYVRVYRKS